LAAASLHKIEDRLVSRVPANGEGEKTIDVEI